MYDIVIIGAGPAGLTAGIYAGRAGLNALVLDKGQSGGTANTAPLVENYPGFDKITGSELMKNISKQAEQYCEIIEFVDVNDIKNEDSKFTIETSKDSYIAKNVIIATGSTHKTLDIESVKEYTGRGVSYCAVCDGNFFVDSDVLVIGGGNSAATEALYLNRIGVNCSIVHRRNKLRCDEKLQKDLIDNNIKIYWNCELKNVEGKHGVEKAIIYNNKTSEEISIDVSGVFIAIGNNPNNKLAIKLGIECDKLGYIITDKNMKTNIKGVLAAGDVTGGVKQIVVSASQGANATTTIQEQLI